LAFSPKMAPISKKHGKQGYGTHPNSERFAVSSVSIHRVL
jgi:hypothetical protein